MNIENVFGGLTKITFESFEKALFRKIADNAKAKIKAKDRTIDSRTMTITVNQYVAREFIETTRAIRDVGQTSFVGNLNADATTDGVIDGKTEKPKKADGRSAPPLPKGESYSVYDVPKDCRWMYCMRCQRYFTEIEAYEFHIRAGHLCRTVDDYNREIRDIAKKVVDGLKE